MKLQLGELRPMIDGLGIILDKELPAKTAYWLSRALKQIMPEFESMELARQKLVNQYAKKDEEGNLITEGDVYVIEDMEAFNAEFAELAEQEFEIKYDPISVEKLGEIKVKGTDIMKLGRLIKDDEEPIAKVLPNPASEE